jgi:hypothetical protein
VFVSSPRPFVCLLSPTSKGLFVELKVGRETKAYLFQIFFKVKDRTQRVSKSYNHDREVHVCGYVVDGVESKRVGCSMILSLPPYIFLDMDNFLVFAWTFVHLSLSFSWALMRPFLSLFFQYIAHAFAGENFGKRLYDIWNIKKDMHEWMVWKCYSSNVEVFACKSGVYVILDYESMKCNS